MAVRETGRPESDGVTEVLEIQDGVVLTAEQIRKIFKGYIGGACGLANIFSDLVDEE